MSWDRQTGPIRNRAAINMYNLPLLPLLLLLDWMEMLESTHILFRISETFAYFCLNLNVLPAFGDNFLSKVKGKNKFVNVRNT